MKDLSLNAGATGTVSGVAQLSKAARRGRTNSLQLAGVSLLALASTGLVSPVSAATYMVANETELFAAIAAAQASPDLASTINLTGTFAVTNPFPAIAGREITVVAGSNNALILSADNTFNVASDAKLTITRIFVRAGTTLVDGGTDITLTSDLGGANRLLTIAGNTGETATLTISGAGTTVTGSGDTAIDSIDLGASMGGGAATLNVDQGGVLQTETSGVRLRGTTAINVTGSGSQLWGAGLSQLDGDHTVIVRDGGVLDFTGTGDIGVAAFGGVNTTVNSTVAGEVSGTGSTLRAATLNLLRGSLKVLAGGTVEANTITVANTQAGTGDFDILVSGAGSKLSATTTFTLGNRGIGVLTIADDGVVSVSNGASPLTVGSALPNSDATLNIGAALGEPAVAAGTLKASAITLAANAEINFNHTEAGHEFDVPINGSGAINQVAGRTIFNANQLGFTGLTTIIGGTLEVNRELGDTGLGFGIVNVTGGTLAGIGTVGDTGLAAGGSIAPGMDGDRTLTINGDYTGSGGLLQIQTVLGDDNSVTNLLEITGNSIGTTNVRVTNVGGAGGQTTNGIRIVDVDGTSGGTFSLLGDTVHDGQQAVIGGAYLYGLHQGTLTDADGDWYLRSILNPDDETPVFQPAAPVIETYAAAALQAFNTTETLQQRVGNRSWSAGTTEGNGLWGRIDARHTSLAPDKSTTGASYQVDTWRLQAGADGVLSDTEDGSVVAGVNLQAGTISAGISSASGDGDIEGTAFGLGGTLTWYGNEGFYLDAQGKLNWFDSTLSANLLDRPLVSGNAGFGYALSLEAGQQLALGGGWSVTPQAQLAYSSVDFETFDSYGSTVALKSGDSLVGRLGISADYETEWQETAGQTGRTHFYGIANLTYEFLDGTATSVGADTLVNEVDPLWGSIGLGGSVNWAGDALSLYGEANLGTSLNHLGDSYSLGVTAGIRGKL
jgi:fibronectin-binding autotransporter adhesin